jgi:hypothetical protein
MLLVDCPQPGVRIKGRYGQKKAAAGQLLFFSETCFRYSAAHLLIVKLIL